VCVCVCVCVCERERERELHQVDRFCTSKAERRLKLLATDFKKECLVVLYVLQCEYLCFYMHSFYFIYMDDDSCNEI
jgi:hypothetical protein